MPCSLIACTLPRRTVPNASRETQLRKAIEKAVLPARDYRVYHALLGLATWGTAVIPEQYQPDSLKDLARIARMSRAGVCRALNHLESHGWVKRDRRSPGRGHSTGYVLSAGADCDCGPGPSLSEPVPDAVRMRRYRNRKKASQGGVTDREKASQGESLPGDKASQSDVTKRLASRNDAAGQTPVSAKSVSDEGGEEEGWPAGTIGATVNPWPPARIPGVRGEPVPADEPTRKVLRTLVDVLGPVEIMGAE